MLKEGEPVPEIYTDPAFGQSNHWELSTSQLSSRFFDGWGYGEGELFCLLFFLSPSIFKMLNCDILSFTVVPDGYGLSYSIGDDYIRWTITSLRRNTAELKRHLAEAATEVKNMLTAAKRFSDSHEKGKL